MLKLAIDSFLSNVLTLSPQNRFYPVIQFFLEDTLKIFFLLTLMIYIMSYARAKLNTEKVKHMLQGKPKFIGYLSASLFGALTPFCSCSSVPLFLGFTYGGIPLGFTMAFLITSPLLNEVAFVLLGSLLGFKFLWIYSLSAIFAGMAGGYLLDKVTLKRALHPEIWQQIQNLGTPSQNAPLNTIAISRHQFAWEEVKSIIKRIWIWIIVGIMIGAFFHGFLPAEWIQQNLGHQKFWPVPIAVLLGIPLYSNASGMIPIIESLLSKGLPVGTALALMLSTVGASFPEFIILHKVLTKKMLTYLFIYLCIAFISIGWILNLVY